MAESVDLRNAVNHSLLILKNNTAPTIADVRTATQLVVGLMDGMNITIVFEDLVRSIEGVVNVHVSDASVPDI